MVKSKEELKLLHKLDEDVQKAIKWVAAESHYLKLLKSDIESLSEILKEAGMDEVIRIYRGARKREIQMWIGEEHVKKDIEMLIKKAKDLSDEEKRELKNLEKHIEHALREILKRTSLAFRLLEGILDELKKGVKEREIRRYEMWFEDTVNASISCINSFRFDLRRADDMALQLDKVVKDRSF